MAITAVFDTALSPQQYDQINDQVFKALQAVGLEYPDGRIYHVASISKNGVFVVDVWESEEKLGKFAEQLMPIIASTGATPAEPVITPVHNIIKGVVDISTDEDA